MVERKEKQERKAVLAYNSVDKNKSYLFNDILPMLRVKGYFVVTMEVTGLESSKLSIGTGPKAVHYGIDQIESAARAAPDITLR